MIVPYTKSTLLIRLWEQLAVTGFTPLQLKQTSFSSKKNRGERCQRS